jgi:plasmid stabilization system protein ParE
MKVVWTVAAKRQLDAAMAFIAEERPATAAQWLHRLLDAAGSLADLPDQGRVVEAAGRDMLLELIVRPYRIVYRHDEDLVYVTAVRHDRRQIDTSNRLGG